MQALKNTIVRIQRRENMVSGFKYILLFLVWTVCFCWLSVTSVDAHEKKSILIISSYNPAAQQTAVTISDFIDEYVSSGGKRDVVIENMNCKSFSEAPRWRGYMERILMKYQGEKEPGLIVLLGQEAWTAYLSLGDSVRRETPVMCSLVSRNAVILPSDTVSLKDWMPESVDFFSGKMNLHEVKSGFLNEYDIEANIHLIKHFYPLTRHIAFVSDNTYGGVTMQALVRKEIKKFADLDLILLDGRSNTIYTIVDKMRKLPEHTVVMVGTWRVDMNEGYFMRNATYAMMEANPAVPAFSCSSVGLGYWAIGGVIPRYKALGRDMAKEAVRMDLHPEDTVRHISLLGTSIMFDSKKVKEWAIDPHSLRGDIEFVNQPPSFYKEYTYQIWAGILLFFILVVGLLVSLFFYFRTKRLKDKLVKSEHQLREAKERAEESNHLKTAFLANMSHEIRTPLNSIVGFSDVLASGDSTKEEQLSYFEIIRTNSDLLLRLINDILDISRLEAGKVSLTWETCDVIQVCNQALTTVSMSRRSQNKYVFKSKFESYSFETDVQRLQQVIINLLSNADKFTHEGVITLEFHTEGPMAFFSVTDTGCGIPKEKQELIFERFEKLNEYAQGTGLGLSICKLIVYKWGGDIWVDQDYASGARFIFSHPLNIEKE